MELIILIYGYLDLRAYYYSLSDFRIIRKNNTTNKLNSIVDNINSYDIFSFINASMSILYIMNDKHNIFNKYELPINEYFLYENDKIKCAYYRNKFNVNYDSLSFEVYKDSHLPASLNDIWNEIKLEIFKYILNIFDEYVYDYGVDL